MHVLIINCHNGSTQYNALTTTFLLAIVLPACHILYSRLLLEGGYKVDVVFTSRLKRAIRSSWLLLKEMNEVYLPVFKSWRLNERMYGALTGLSKTETAVRMGAELVQEW